VGALDATWVLFYQTRTIIISSENLLDLYHMFVTVVTVAQALVDR